jgi:ATP-dependent Lhr-like helicase
LKEEGASFATDIQTGTGLRGEELASALAELTLAGMVTNDEIETLRNLVEHGAVVRTGKFEEARTPRKPLSELERELGERLGPRPMKMTQYRMAKRRTMERIQKSVAQQASPWRGRWTLTQRAGILGAPLSDEERAAKWARLLLERYGVVTRLVLEREDVPNLDLVYAEWQRMEWRGQARRGIFVAGMQGLQYALPDAVERLRSDGGRRTEDEGGSAGEVGAQIYVLNATDPANVFGGGSLGEERFGATHLGEIRFARVPSTYVVLADGQPVLIAQENGERLTTAEDVPSELVRRAVAEFWGRPGAPRRAVVEEWNGASVLGSEGEKILSELGFYRSPKGMELWKR